MAWYDYRRARKIAEAIDFKLLIIDSRQDVLGILLRKKLEDGEESESKGQEQEQAEEPEQPATDRTD